MRSLFSCAVAAGFLTGLTMAIATGPAHAEDTQAVRKSITIAELQAIVQNAGYQAKIMSDDSGEYIQSSTSGITFYVSLYNCDKAKPAQCTTVDFDSATFVYEKVPLEKFNAYNSKTAWASRAILNDDGKPVLRFYTETTGGVTDGFLARALDIWVGELESFQKAIAP